MSPIRLVLDTSAIVAYAQTVDVGETLGEVADDGGARFALPVACLVEAAAAVGPEVLAPLVASKAAVVVDLTAADWLSLAASRELLGALDVASALVCAERYGCDILTSATPWYAALGDDPPIIPLG